MVNDEYCVWSILALGDRLHQLAQQAVPGEDGRRYRERAARARLAPFAAAGVTAPPAAGRTLSGGEDTRQRWMRVLDADLREHLRQPLVVDGRRAVRVVVVERRRPDDSGTRLDLALEEVLQVATAGTNVRHDRVRRDPLAIGRHDLVLQATLLLDATEDHVAVVVRPALDPCSRS